MMSITIIHFISNGILHLAYWKTFGENNVRVKVDPPFFEKNLNNYHLMICYEYEYEKNIDLAFLEKSLKNNYQKHLLSYLVQVSPNDNYQHSDKIRLVCISPELPLLKLWKPLQELLNKGRIEKTWKLSCINVC